MKGKKIYKKLMFLLLIWVPVLVSAQTAKRITVEEYIGTYRDLAVREMMRTSIPASITLAQGLLESGNGNSRLAKEANNHFGIKCKKDWAGRSINVDDDAPQECFRAYDRAEDSYDDHSDFLAKGDRYAFLFDLDPLDYKEWAKGLKQAGYATNPRYSDLLIDVIERYRLYEYDKGNKRRNKEEKIDKKEEEQPLITEKENSVTKPEKFEYNGAPAYVVKDGDTYESITKTYKMVRFEIRKYNDLDKQDVLEPGTIIYLKPKKRKGDQELHVVKEGESMYYISQIHRIKLKRLYKLNQMKSGQEPLAGQTLNLRKKRDLIPALNPNPGFAAKKRGIMIEQKQPQQPAMPQIKSNNPPKDLRNKPAENVAKPDILAKKEAVTEVAVNPTTSKSSSVKKDPFTEIDTLLPKKMEETIQYLSEEKEVTKKPVAENKVYENKPKANVQVNNSQKAQVQQPAGISPAETNNYHTVQSGETMYSISRRYGLSVEKLKELNNIKDNSIAHGQKLKVGAGSNVGLQQAQLPDEEYHEVQQGESLYGISKKYSLSVEQIKQLNGLEDNSISIGQKLKVK